MPEPLPDEGRGRTLHESVLNFNQKVVILFYDSL